MRLQRLQYRITLEIRNMHQKSVAIESISFDYKFHHVPEKSLEHREPPCVESIPAFLLLQRKESNQFVNVT